ncbi:hypothetical protein CTAM01_01033 [Colletotrichum tamarilloi]|uniref:Uncharacterized protein n=1 Tax=Colletotrichum tamarilloi TaxID=1209934 RepID=A0ABQ9RTQ5_9PEZI|nr:uncharacterized protein CTAM01_01033 [Colletotrichum tamarilloi]KAK1512103.1 hypothetical protein CTAM01_01033 [Colletotrichum tamarilloi]
MTAFRMRLKGKKSTTKTSEIVVENERGLDFAGGRSRWVWSMDCRCGMRTSNVVGAADRKSLGPWWCCRASFAGRCRCSSLPGLGDLVDEPILQSPGQLTRGTPHNRFIHTPPPSPPGRRPNPTWLLHPHFPESNIAALALGLGPKQQLSAVDGVPLTAPHVRSVPMSPPRLSTE